jgi:hypothetical protein
MMTTAKLTLWFIAIVAVGLARPSLTPPSLSDRLWAWVIICAFPVGAFLSARRARCGIPFIVYAGLAAALYTYDDFQTASSIRGFRVSDESIIVHNLLRTTSLLVACRLAASLRWWLSRRTERKEGPRCAECSYLLIGLTEPRCPECGQPFDLRLLSGQTLSTFSQTLERKES